MADLSGQFAPENYNRVLAALLMKQGLDTSPIQSWTQGAARLAQALVGARYRDLDRADTIAAMQYNPMVSAPMGNKVAEALAPSQGITPPSMPVEGGGSVPVPPPRPIFNRSAFTDEANQPEMAQRLATIVQGEVGRNATPEQKAIQLESILNRAAARNQTLGDVTQQYTGPGSSGYYPASTFASGQASPIETQQFAQNVLTPALRGSDVSGATLGFPATGNASGNVAANGINNGRYSQYASLGPPGAQETYVQQPGGKEDIARLEATRLAQNTQSPIDAMAANVEKTLADPNAPLAVKQKAYAYKQWILQHRMEQSMKYGPEALTGEGALAGAKATAESNAKLPGQIILKQTPAYSDIPANAGAKTAAEEAAKVSPDIIFGQATAAGAKTTAEQTAKQAVQLATTEKTSRQAAGFMHGLVNEAITQIDKHPKTAAGPVGQYTSGMQWSPAGVLDSTLLGIRSRISFEELNKMRAASPTGGALGQVSDPEERMLGSVYGGITTGLPAEVLKARLRRLERVYNAVVNVGPEAAAKEFSKSEPGDVQDAQTSGGIRRYNPATGRIE